VEFLRKTSRSEGNALYLLKKEGGSPDRTWGASLAAPESVTTRGERKASTFKGQEENKRKLKKRAGLNREAKSISERGRVRLSGRVGKREDVDPWTLLLITFFLIRDTRSCSTRMGCMPWGKSLEKKDRGSTRAVHGSGKIGRRRKTGKSTDLTGGRDVRANRLGKEN